LILEVAVSVSAVAWTLVQILKTLVDWKLDRRIKEEQLRELIFENTKRYRDLQSPNSSLSFENSLIRDATRLGMNEQINIKEIKDVDLPQPD
jgi:hypothetical protein